MGHTRSQPQIRSTPRSPDSQTARIEEEAGECFAQDDNLERERFAARLKACPDTKQDARRGAEAPLYQQECGAAEGEGLFLLRSGEHIIAEAVNICRNDVEARVEFAFHDRPLPGRCIKVPDGQCGGIDA